MGELLPSIDLAEFDIAPAVIELVSMELARRLRVFPVNRVGDTLIVGMVEPIDPGTIGELQALTGCTIEPVAVSLESLEGAFRRYYGN